MLTERERHMLYALFNMKTEQFYQLERYVCNEARTTEEALTHHALHVRRGQTIIHFSAHMLRALNPNILNNGKLFTTTQVITLEEYAKNADIRHQLGGVIMRSLLEHPITGASLKNILTKLVTTTHSSQLPLQSPSPLFPENTDLLRYAHDLSGGVYHLFIERTSTKIHGVTYQIVNEEGNVMPLNEAAMRSMNMLSGHTLTFVMPGGSLEQCEFETYLKNPNYYQPQLTRWALNHKLYANFREEVRRRGAHSPTPSTYLIGIPIHVT